MHAVSQVNLSDSFGEGYFFPQRVQVNGIILAGNFAKVLLADTWNSSTVSVDDSVHHTVKNLPIIAVQFLVLR